jgi:thiamine monophosphate synthase
VGAFPPPQRGDASATGHRWAIRKRRYGAIGITEENIDAVLAAGADMVRVIAAVVAAPDLREAARRLVACIAAHRAGGGDPRRDGM